jgi:hypothetical protein
MWLIAIVCLAGLAIAAIWLGFVPPPHASTLIRVRDGAVRVRRGMVKSDVKAQMAEILTEAGVSRGFIAVTPDNRVAFSRRIPPTVHQRLRNVLLNQWA